MSHPGLDPDLAAALEALAELGPLQLLDVRPTPSMATTMTALVTEILLLMGHLQRP